MAVIVSILCYNVQYNTSNMTPLFLIVHHSFTPKDLPAGQAESSFNTTHKNQGYPISSLGWYIGYHYVIYGNGEVRQYRQDKEIGAHTAQQNMNFQSLGICLSGNFDTELPNPAQTEALRKWLVQKTGQWNIPATNIYPHRKFVVYKSCYGSRLADDWARNLIINQQGSLPPVIIKKQGEPTLYLQESDVAVPFSVDFASFQADFGAAKIIELSAAEFSKFKVSSLRIIKV